MLLNIKWRYTFVDDFLYWIEKKEDIWNFERLSSVDMSLIE